MRQVGVPRTQEELTAERRRDQEDRGVRDQQEVVYRGVRENLSDADRNALDERIRQRESERNW